MSFVIYEDEFYSGMLEVAMQQSELFNGASNNTMNIVPREHIGDFSKEAFFTETADVVTRRDITSNADGTASDLAADEVIGVKLYRRFQYDKKLTDIKRIGFTEQEYSFFVGQQIAKAKILEMLNTGLLGLVTTLGINAANFLSIVGNDPETLNYDSLPSLLQKFGDRSPELRHVVGHSKPLHNLLGDSFNTETENVAGFSINTGQYPLLGRSVAMTDSANLIDPEGAGSDPDVASYKTLFLAQNALRLEESEDETVWSGVVDGKENLVVRVQGEFGYTIKVKGFEYSSATNNPTAAALGTAGNWGQVASDTKSTAGVYIETA
jgi:hypothetical protein